MPDDSVSLFPSQIDQAQWEKDPDGYIKAKVKTCTDLILSVDDSDLKAVKLLRDQLFGVGVAAQEYYWQCNDTMSYSLQRLVEDNHHDQEVTALLAKLHRVIEQVKPPQRVRPSLKDRFLLLFSLKETAWQLWLEQYQSAKKHIQIITKQLQTAQQQLQRDNQILLTDQNKLFQAKELLLHDYDLLSQLLESVQARMEIDKTISEGVRHVIETDLYEPLESRMIELQQQLLIARQAVMTLDLMMTQNDSWVRNIEQALYNCTAVLDVTASLVVVKQKGQQNPADQSKPAITTEQLKQARNVINQALTEIEAVEEDKESTG